MRTAAFLTLTAAIGLAVGCGKSTPGTPGGEGPDAASADKERLQGVWAVESLDSGDPDDTIPEAERKAMRLVVQGDTLRIAEPDTSERFSFVPDAASNPKVLIVTRLGPDGKLRQASVDGTKTPDRQEWLYKFDGDSLVLAVTDREGPRPKEFKADPGRPGTGIKGGPGGVVVTDPGDPGVMLVRLTKVSEQPPPEPKRPPRFSGATKK